MARTKQTARKTAGRKGIAKKSALASTTPATKSHTSKRKGYVLSDWSRHCRAIPLTLETTGLDDLSSKKTPTQRSWSLPAQDLRS
jgi:hypothetical protein